MVVAQINNLLHLLVYVQYCVTSVTIWFYCMVSLFFIIIIIIIITHGQNINLPVCMCLCVCICVRHTFCQLAYTGHTHQRIFTVDSLKDADFRRDVPFGGIDYK